MERPGAVRMIGKTQRSLLAGFLFACAFSGCRPENGEEGILSLSLAAAPALEAVARNLTGEFNLLQPQGIPLAVVLLPEADRQAAEADYAAVLDWREPEAGMWSARIGWTGIVFAVHPDNPLSDLSAADAGEIFSGRIIRWDDVGGPSGMIRAVAYASDSDWTEVFSGVVLGENRMATGAVIVPSVGAMRSAVSHDSLAVGFALGCEPVPELRVLTLDGAAPVYPNLLSGKYPFRIPIYLESNDPPPMEIQQFAGWLQSVPGQTLLMQLHPQE
jgi:ABC-type phosphate transport system substrate-binding protein